MPLQIAYNGQLYTVDKSNLFTAVTDYFTIRKHLRNGGSLTTVPCTDISGACTINNQPIQLQLH